MHPAARPPEQILAECEQTFLRRSGPGGQNRNKVETAVLLKHRPTGLSAEANERRSQSENKEEALLRLRWRMALEVRGDVPEGAPPSELWRSRLKGGKVALNPAHPDGPAIVAEVLDRIVVYGHDVKAAAEALGCSSSQLVKILKIEPRALAMVNQTREAKGLRALL